MENINWHHVLDVAGVVISVASFASNFIPNNTILFKVIHFLALNFDKLRTQYEANNPNSHLPPASGGSTTVVSEG